LSQDSFLGGFFAGRNQGNGYNLVLGTDGQLRVNPSSLVGYHVFLSQTKPDEQSQNKNGYALGLHYEYTTRDWIIMLGLQDIAKNFETETGYITRTGLTRLRTEAGQLISSINISFSGPSLNTTLSGNV
jgi:hypothetical protein